MRSAVADFQPVPGDMTGVAEIQPDFCTGAVLVQLCADSTRLVHVSLRQPGIDILISVGISVIFHVDTHSPDGIINPLRGGIEPPRKTFGLSRNGFTAGKAALTALSFSEPLTRWRRFFAIFLLMVLLLSVM